jgi:hypothetical protein
MNCTFSTDIADNLTCCTDGEFDDYGFPLNPCPQYPCKKYQDIVKRQHDELHKQLKLQSLKAVIICGDRNWTDTVAISNCTKYLSNRCIVISGGAKGADTIAESLVPPINFKKFPADWSKHGKAAGPIRNKLMLDHRELLMPKGISFSI